MNFNDYNMWIILIFFLQFSFSKKVRVAAAVVSLRKKSLHEHWGWEGAFEQTEDDAEKAGVDTGRIFLGCLRLFFQKFSFQMG